MKRIFQLLLFSFSILLSFTRCNTEPEMKNTIEEAPFGSLQDGTPVNIYTLKNKNNVEVKITNYGGIIVSVLAPDKDGNFADVVLGFDDLKGYEGENPYFGCITGRYANRIAKGQFVIGSDTFNLAKNDGPNHLHGGLKPLNRRVWEAKASSNDNSSTLTLSYLSPDGEEGYPGNLSCTVTYTLNDDNGIVMNYKATTDKTTIVNLTNHSYFNLKDSGSTDILSHNLRIYADEFTPVDSTLIPTGEFSDVEGTPFDFQQSKAIGREIAAKHLQMGLGKGYDHNFVLNKKGPNEGDLSIAAELYEPNTGRLLEVWTTEPGIQFYSGNFLDGTLTGKNGIVYPYRGAICLETQHYPDSPNQPNFPSVLLKPGEEYNSTTIYKFKVR